MEKNRNDDFFNPLKTRPGLTPRAEFKQNLKLNIESISKKKRNYHFIKIPALVTVALFIMMLAFSKDLIGLLNREGGTEPRGQQGTIIQGEIDQIRWAGSTYINKNDGTETITGELIGNRLGEITEKVTPGENQELQDGQATKLEAGTTVYAVHGTSNITVKIDGKWIMYVKAAKVHAEITVDDDSLTKDDIGLRLLEKYWDHKKDADDITQSIMDYEITGINFEKETKDGFIFSVTFNLKPEEVDQYSLQGTGHREGEWLKENHWFVEVKQVGNTYEMVTFSPELMLHEEPDYLSEEQAINIGKSYVDNADVDWTAEWVEEFQAEGSQEVRAAWKVTASYPLGNKDIFYLDAEEGILLLSQEKETGGFGE